MDFFKADFGFMPSHSTKSDCKNPQFLNKKRHRIAIMKDEHFGSKGDRDENGISGWSSKFVCTGCGKKFKINKLSGYFAPDKVINNE